jgi:phosphonate transport system permease protein
MTDAILKSDTTALARMADAAIPRHPLSRRLRSWFVWAVIFALLAWSFAPAEMFRVSALFTDWRNMAQFGAAFLKPGFHDWQQYLADMIVTVQIAIWRRLRSSSASRSRSSAPPTSARHGSCSLCAG